MGIQGLLRLTEGVGGEIQTALGAVHRVVNGIEGVHAALDGLQLRAGGESPGGGLQGLYPVVGRGHVQPGALHCPEGIRLIRRVMAGQKVLDLLQLLPEGVHGLPVPGGRGCQSLQLSQGGAEGAGLLLRLGQEAGLVVPAGVPLALELLGGGGEGGVLFAGGNQRGDALLQGLALLHRKAGLADIGAALKDILRNPQEGLAAAGGGEDGHRVGGAGVDGGK